jgi:hypothetical protein
MTAIPKIWFSNLGMPMTPDILEYCAENEWDVCLSITTGNLIDDAADIIENWIDLFEGEGISTWVACQFADINMSVDDYDALYGAGLDVFNASATKGYGFEGGYKNGITWIKANTSKQLVHWWMANYYLPDIGGETWETWWGDEGTYHDIYGTFDWRIDQFDLILQEMYWQQDILQCIELGGYIHENHPDTPYGVISCLNATPGGEIWWGETIHDTDPTHLRTFAGQQLLAHHACYTVQAATGNFDIFGCMCGTPDAYNPSYIDSLTWWDGCKGLWGVPLDMCQYGLIPHYVGASYCGHDDTPIPDTFVNTGSELLLLKNYGTGCTVHDITITGTDETIDYTLAVSPDRGTPIGPFPLEQFGALPTITYDNTNLYISILKDVPA